MNDKAGSEQGKKHLQRLETFLDVLYALLFFQMLHYLPQGEDMAWADKPLGLLSLLWANADDLLRIFVGLALTIIYWNLNNKLCGPLVRTNGRHAILALLQMFFVCLFIYFAISDPGLAGGPSSPALQCVSLFIAGFVGLWGWSYAGKNQLVNEDLTEAEKDRVARSGLIEPITALLNTPLAFVGPMAWTLGWFIIPFPVMWVIRKSKSPEKDDPGSVQERNV
jgi:uncharacterized membrane protein